MIFYLEILDSCNIFISFFDLKWKYLNIFVTFVDFIIKQILKGFGKLFFNDNSLEFIFLGN